MIKYVIYGKIIIDDIRTSDGRFVQDVLGGGGPQGAFGARIWSDSVGLLSRSGMDISAAHKETIERLAIDVSGWVKYPDILTPHAGMAYDEEGERSGFVVDPDRAVGSENWVRLLSQPLTLPPDYQNPVVIHLICYRPTDPMIKTALVLKARGTIFSLEPIMDYHRWSNRDDFINLFKQVDVITPDWLSASGLAGSDDPGRVLKFWSNLGPAIVAIRHGQYGSYTWDRQHDKCWHVPVLPVKVIDPTGAGNCYGGGLCVGWHKTGDARMAGCYGTVSASFLVRQFGLPKMSAELQLEAQVLLQQVEAAAQVF
jgi:sugar/nucleoside kinase (ribokinase family)